MEYLRSVLKFRRKLVNGVLESPWDYRARTARKLNELFKAYEV